jgi:hypothetical protein
VLWRPTVKAALVGSVAWSLAVRWLGEGLGGLFTGTASPITGAPGAVLLYALIAVLAWPASGIPGRADRTGLASRRNEYHPLGGISVIDLPDHHGT